MAVLITGFGVQTPLGCSFAESQETLSRGTPCIGDIENYDIRGYDITAAGEVRCGGKVVRTTHGVDRKIYFFNRAMKELSAATDYASRYAPEELMLNLGGGMDHLDVVPGIARHSASLRGVHHPMLATLKKSAGRVSGVREKWNFQSPFSSIRSAGPAGTAQSGRIGSVFT